MSESAPRQAEAEGAEPLPVTGGMRRWAHRSAADYLGKHASSASHLHKVMARRAARRHPEIGREGCAALADEAVAFCREHAFVDDTTYAAMKVRSGVRKGFSRRRIGAGLAAKGIDAETAGEALAQSDDWTAAVAFARRRRFGPWRKAPPDPETRKKEAGAFARNGFGGDIAFKLLDMTVEEAEEFGSPDQTAA